MLYYCNNLPWNIVWLHNNNLFVFMYSVGIFALAKQSSLFDYLGRLKFIKDVSALSFGIYILHTTVLNVLNKLFKLYPDYFMPIVGELIFAVVAFVGAYVMTALCRRIPILGRYL